LFYKIPFEIKKFLRFLKNNLRYQKNKNNAAVTHCIEIVRNHTTTEAARMYFVYKFIDSKDEVIYVGKTKVGIRNRINQHFSNSGHLSKECYRQVQRIEYQTIPNKLEMDIKELYYIENGNLNTIQLIITRKKSSP